jgi:hypothetical protein
MWRRADGYRRVALEDALQRAVLIEDIELGHYFT